jgi:hypothetical protein
MECFPSIMLASMANRRWCHCCSRQGRTSLTRQRQNLSCLFFLIHFLQTGLSPSPLDLIKTETKEGKACYCLMKKLMVLPPLFLFRPETPTSPPPLFSLSSLCFTETVPVALLPSQSLQSESKPKPRQSPRPKSESESGPQAEFVEEGGRDL